MTNLKRVRFPLNPEIRDDFQRLKREMHYTESQAAQYLVEKGLESIRRKTGCITAITTSYDLRKSRV